MVTVLGYSPKVSVETIWRDTFWLLIVTISISDPIPPGLDLKLVSLYEPFVTLMDGQKPPVRFPLIWFNDGIWRNFWTTLVEPSQPMRELVVAVRNGFGGKYTQSKDDTWKMSLDLTPKIHLQATAEYQTPVFINHSDSQIPAFPSISDGDRWSYNITELQDPELSNHENRYSTPIEEEQMETFKHAGSSEPPLDVRDWFYEDYHDVTCSQTNKSSLSQSPIVDSQFNLMTDKSPEQLEIVSTAPSSPISNTT